MKKHNCRMTSEEKAIHDFAVKVRKMTDKQLYDFVNANTKNENRVNEFLQHLNKSVVNGKMVKGVGPVTYRSIKEFAIKEGFIIGN